MGWREITAHIACYGTYTTGHSSGCKEGGYPIAAMLRVRQIQITGSNLLILSVYLLITAVKGPYEGEKRAYDALLHVPLARHSFGG